MWLHCNHIKCVSLQPKTFNNSRLQFRFLQNRCMYSYLNLECIYFIHSLTMTKIKSDIKNYQPADSSHPNYTVTNRRPLMNKHLSLWA